MRHCTAEELMDVVDGAREEASLRHLATCEHCTSALRELRQVLSAVKRVPVPEPSPLFWDHLSARVREAVAAEPGPSIGWRLGLPLAGVVAALVLAVFAVPHLRQRGEAPATRAASADRPEVLASPEVATATDDDPSIGLMLDLVDGLDLDTVANAGLTASADATDAAFDELSADERRELERLLKEAMGSPGA